MQPCLLCTIIILSMDYNDISPYQIYFLQMLKIESLGCTNQNATDAYLWIAYLVDGFISDCSHLSDV